MKFKLIKSSILAVVVAICLSTVSWAVIPPPPVNQNLGIPDGVFENLIQADCRKCHENPGTFPVKDIRIPDRHHLTVQRDGNDCKDCHKLEADANGNLSLAIFRDCPVCHFPGVKNQAGEWILKPGSPHHKTQFAKDKMCFRCHGSLVNPPPDAGPNRDGSMSDNHFIPDYPRSLITPNTKLEMKANGILGPVWFANNPALNKAEYDFCKLRDAQGNCKAGGCRTCHMPGTDPVRGIQIGSNPDNHHGTGLGVNQGTSCDFCHVTDGSGPVLDIRKCEECHGISTVHNIMFNYDQNVGTPGWGHIGESRDCFGCHGWFDKYGVAGAAEIAPGQGATVPFITSVEPAGLASGVPTRVTLRGSDFQNGLEGNVYSSHAVLENKATGEKYEFANQAINATGLRFDITQTLDPGVYYLHLVKDDKVSNMMAITVVVNFQVTSLKGEKNAAGVTEGVIRGSGFGPKPSTEYDSPLGFYVERDGRKAKHNIISWTDNEIHVDVITNCGVFTLVTLNGGKSHTIPCK